MQVRHVLNTLRENDGGGGGGKQGGGTAQGRALVLVAQSSATMSEFTPRNEKHGQGLTKTQII